MKKGFLFLFLAAVIFQSCKKEQKCGYATVYTTASSSEITAIEAYLASQAITTAIQDPSGVFYTINTVGTGDTASSLCNNITMTYYAYKFGSPIVFDSYQDAAGKTFTLGALILGVQKIIPHVKAGGSVTMYIPPSLAYGNQVITDPNTGSVILPANSYIKFEIGLLAVN
jgi:FKBP-type peptidyl-prolyl cis-trans isomerase